MADATDDGLITEPTLHLCLNEHAIRALATAARKSNLQLIADQIEAQLPKAPVEEPTEPTEFGSMVRARQTLGGLPVIWCRGSQGGWESEPGGYVAFFDALHDVEVLRVGVGEPEQPWRVLDHLREVKNAGYIVSMPASTSEARAAGYRAGVKAERAAAATGIPVAAPEPTPEQVEECPLCGSTDPGLVNMVPCGFPCDDAARWHILGINRQPAEQVEAASAPGVPVEKVRGLASALRGYAAQDFRADDERKTYGLCASGLDILIREASALLPKEPTS